MEEKKERGKGERESERASSGAKNNILYQFI